MQGLAVGPASLDDFKKTKIGQINDVVFYDSGYFEKVDPAHPDGLYGGNISNIKWAVSWPMNELKAKLYNLIEGAITDQRQAKALKGLIKGFSNDAYFEMKKQIRQNYEEMGFKDVLEKADRMGGPDSLEMYEPPTSSSD